MQRKKFLALMLTVGSCGAPGLLFQLWRQKQTKVPISDRLDQKLLTQQKKIAGDHGGPVGGDHYI